MSISASFDRLLRGGRVICPASGIDAIRDIAVRNGKIAAVQPDILPTSAREVIDVTGKLVLPGLIDTHAHVYQYVTGRFGMNADMVGVQSGVTTLVDQGGPSCMTLPGFRHFVAVGYPPPGTRLPVLHGESDPFEDLVDFVPTRHATLLQSRTDFSSLYRRP